MKVYLGVPRGFCAGVVRAIDVVDLALDRYGSPVYVKHQIVHNPYVVKSLEAKGAKTVEDVNEIPKGATVVFSAHGSPPGDFEKAKIRNLNVVDATCPLVTKVHLEAIRFAKLGYHIVLIGHEGHDEVVGTMGEVPQSIVLVESEEEVDQLDFPEEARVAYLTQTTLSVDDASRIIRRLEKRFPQITSPAKEDICYATQNRQEAVRLLAKEANLVLVLGSQNSSNSQRLKEISWELNIPAQLIDGVEDIDPGWFDGIETVLITAGASAPESVVEDCVAYLQENYQAEVEVRTIREEEVHFQLPVELRKAMG